jgi:hypothetical protein
MKRFIAWVLYIAICLLGQRAAVAGLVAGRVVDVATHGPVAGARISIPGTELTTTSAADGSFSIQNEVKT